MPGAGCRAWERGGHDTLRDTQVNSNQLLLRDCVLWQLVENSGLHHRSNRSDSQHRQ